MLRKALFLLFLVTAIPSFATAGTKKLEPIFLNFDLGSQKLPKRYEGHNFKRIFTDLSKIQKRIARGEFEKTEEYSARIAKLKSRTKLGGLPIDSLFVLKINQNLKCEYNPDIETLYATISADNVYSEGGIESSRMALKGFNLESDSSSYVGTNAFGASIVVKKYRDQLVNFTPSNAYDFFDKTLIGFADRTISLSKISPDFAARLTKNLSAIVIYKIKDITIYSGTFYAKATFDSPVDLLNSIDYIEAEIIEIWLYDYVTGAVIQKIKKNVSGT